MTIERQRLIDKDIERLGYEYMIELIGLRINDLQDTYNPSTDIIEQIELCKETLFYIKRKKREQTLNSLLE
jgi:hypothetical protein